jgi:hypothetical protein
MMEFVINYAVFVKVNLFIVARSDKAISFFGEEGTYTGRGHLLALLHISALAPGIVFELSAGCVKTVSDCYIEVFMRISLDNQFGTGYGYSNLYVV